MLKVYAATSITTQVADESASDLGQLLQLIITKIPLWIAAAILIFVAVLIAKISRRIVENKLADKGIGQDHREMQILGGRLAYSTVLILGITVGLKVGGIDLTTIIAAAAFGIGFALKDLIMNFLAGIFILVNRHFVLGDFISIGNTTGQVMEIQSRVTILQAMNGTKVIVPNSEIFRKQVISFTSNPFRRIDVSVGIDYRNNLENAIRVCKKAVQDTQGVLLDPKPIVVVEEFLDKGVRVTVEAWVESKGGWAKIKSELAKNLKKSLDEYGIIIPWPISTIVYEKDQSINEKMLEEPQQTAVVAPPQPQPVQVTPPPQL